MRNKIILLLMVVIIMLGCKSVTPNLEPEVINYHQGFSGLELDTAKNLPPKEIIQGNDFIIGLELENQGAYDIKEGKIQVYGFENGYVSVDQPSVYFDIEGKKPGFPNGGYEIINIKARNIGVPELSKIYPAAFTIRACYDYQTQAQTEVCINPDLYSYIKTKDIVCEPGEILLSKGQGAPVAVTKIEEAISPIGSKIKVDFLIHIENKGEGEVKGNIKINEVKLSDIRLTCIQDEVEFDADEKATILCSTESQLSAGAYLAPLSVKLDYSYTQILDKKVEIRSLRISK